MERIPIVVVIAMSTKLFVFQGHWHYIGCKENVKCEIFDDKSVYCHLL
jgi:hypothetical protein